MRKILTIIFLLTACFISQLYGETIYFVAGEIDPNRNDSYVLPLSDANAIAHARYLIQMDGHVVLEPYIIAKIECGADGINRNYLSPIKALWNWHVTEFQHFSEVGGPYGHPALVQNDCQGWMEDTNGYIGFYTVVAELGTDPNHWERDFDSDNSVNYTDFSWLSNYWLAVCNEPVWCGGSDLNKSSSVDYNDLRIFAQSWLSPFADEPVWLTPWDNPYQCHGDADGKTEGFPLKRRVYTLDLAIFVAQWGKHYGDFGYDGAADFDRDGDVDEDDEDIMMRWFGVVFSDVPADCPTQ